MAKAKLTPKQRVVRKHTNAKSERKTGGYWYVQGQGAWGVFVHGHRCIGRGRTAAAAWADAARTL